MALLTPLPAARDGAARRIFPHPVTNTAQQVTAINRFNLLGSCRTPVAIVSGQR